MWTQADNDISFLLSVDSNFICLVTDSPLGAICALSSVDSSVLSEMQNSSITFNVSYGKLPTDTNGTTTQNGNYVDVKINRKFFGEIVNSAIVLGHETVHCYGIILDPDNQIEDSLYEEAIAFKYQFEIGSRFGRSSYSYLMRGTATKAAIADGTDSRDLAMIFDGTSYEGLSPMPGIERNWATNNRTLTVHLDQYGNSLWNRFEPSFCNSNDSWFDTFRRIIPSIGW
jgi:hypothetical protein